MCEKGALWVEGSKPVSQEAASLPAYKDPGFFHFFKLFFYFLIHSYQEQVTLITPKN